MKKFIDKIVEINWIQYIKNDGLLRMVIEETKEKIEINEYSWIVTRRNPKNP